MAREVLRCPILIEIAVTRAFRLVKRQADLVQWKMYSVDQDPCNQLDDSGEESEFGLLDRR